MVTQGYQIDRIGLTLIMQFSFPHTNKDRPKPVGLKHSSPVPLTRSQPYNYYDAFMSVKSTRE